MAGDIRHQEIGAESIALPHGITLRCRVCGPRSSPPILFLHGFPEAAFVWDALLQRFGERFRCVAPNLRGYAGSSAPAGIEAYRAKHLVADVVALIDALGGRVAALVAHDWGGALAWNLAARHPERVERLVIVNAPHPATFLRELQRNPAQQAASAYMHFLRRADAPARLAENDYARLWPFFTAMGGAAWLDDTMRARYREAWAHGLAGPCHYYGASPLCPPTPDVPGVLAIQLADADVRVQRPTTVIWGEGDTALRPELLDGLGQWVPELQLHRVAGATHWIVHEQPQLVGDLVEAALARPAPV